MSDQSQSDADLAPLRRAQTAGRVSMEIAARTAADDYHRQSVQVAQITAQRQGSLFAAIMASSRPVLTLTANLRALLGVTSTATAAWIARQGQHSFQNHPGEAADCFAILAHRDTRLVYFGTNPNYPDTHQIVFERHTAAPGEINFVLVPLRFHPAGIDGRAADECVALSTYPMRRRGVRSHVRKGWLRVIEQSAEWLGDFRPPP
jgi:hypothetical protein